MLYCLQKQIIKIIFWLTVHDPKLEFYKYKRQLKMSKLKKKVYIFYKLICLFIKMSHIITY